MTIIKRTIIFASLIIFCAAAALNASPQSDAKAEIAAAKNAYEKLEKMTDIQAFIPHLNYSSGRDNFIKAGQFFKDKEYPQASYYAVLAAADFEICQVLGERNLYRMKTIIADRDFYREKAKKEMLKAAVASADLKKQGKSYVGNINDSSIFQKNTFNLDDRGKDVLDRIFDILELYPESKLLVKGHTKWGGAVNETNSLKKAKTVSEYFILIKGFDEARVEVSGMANKQPLGRAATDRIEVVITGDLD